VASAAGLPSPELLAALRHLRENDPSLKVREAARKALEGKVSRLDISRSNRRIR
jgi:hypothetical protein